MLAAGGAQFILNLEVAPRAVLQVPNGAGLRCRVAGLATRRGTSPLGGCHDPPSWGGSQGPLPTYPQVLSRKGCADSVFLGQMVSIRSWPVRRLLVVGSAAVALTTLAVSSGIGIWTSWWREQGRIQDALGVSASLVAADIVRAAPAAPAASPSLGATRPWLTLADGAAEPGLTAALSALHNDPGVHAARILRPDPADPLAATGGGQPHVVAQWTRSSPAVVGSPALAPAGARADFARHADDLIEVRSVIERRDLPLSTLQVSGYRPSLWAIASKDIGWALPGIVVALLASLLLGVRLAAFIMRPMRQLARAARATGRGGDYSVRLPLPADPELAAVAQEFNQMAALLGQRDAMLEGKVRERTSALQAARVAADAANVAKTRFLALVSHEIRTPLNGVVGSAEVLRQAPLAPRDLAHVGHISQSAQALQRIVDDVLDLTGLDSGRLALALGDVVPAELLQQVLEPQAAAAQVKGLRWQTDVTAACDSARRLDARRLSQVLSKLLDNAVKFTARGQVALHADIGHDQQLVVRIADTGEGFAPHELPRLLRPFEQAHSDAARLHQGSGLGLAVAQVLCDVMGARLVFESAPGEGTVVTLSLHAPRGVGATRSETPADHPTPALASGAVAYAGPILVVEDNEVNRYVITAMLERLGASQVHVATSGAQAVQMAEQVAYDLVLMDWQMPVMDGLEAISLMRAREAAQAAAGQPGRHTPIVAVTANAMPGDKERCLRAGADGYLSKPLRLDDLRAAMLQFYRRSVGPA
jgi:two-component system, sensor histidine kinase